VSDKEHQIFIEGIPVDSIKDDQKLATMFEEFADKIYRVADKKFVALCKKYDKTAKLTVIVSFKEAE
jgi:hypothetical protein